MTIKRLFSENEDMRFLGFTSLMFLVGPSCFAQTWAVGIGGGYGAYENATVKNAAGTSAEAGFRSRVAATAVLTEDMFERIGGELRYTYRDGGSQFRANGQGVDMDAVAHVVHYDFLFYGTRRHARVRPFFAAGAGIKRYDATGRGLQPFDGFGTLTHTHQVEGMVSAGAGVKVALGDRWVLRLDFRDYMTPFPETLFRPPVNASVHGWLHDFVPMIGVDWTFGGR